MLNELSVLIAVQNKIDDSMAQLHERYENALREAGVKKMEFIYLVNPELVSSLDIVKALAAGRPNVQIIELARDFGEATSINIGGEQASYEHILTLPSTEMVKAEAIADILPEINECDVVMAKRSDRVDSGLRQLPSRMMTAIIGRFSKAPFADGNCGVRLFKKKVLQELNMYGDFHRFMSILSYEQGFQVKLVDMPQSESDQTPFSSPLLYLRNLLDVLTILFLTRFNKRPLRFFGSIGTTSLIIGSLGMAVVAFQRLFLDMAAADRPILLLFVLLAALGIQLIAIGLVGETLIFTHARDIKEYKIKKIHSSK